MHRDLLENHRYNLKKNNTDVGVKKTIEVSEKKVKSEEIITSAFKVDKELIRNVEIFDLFEDDSLGKDKKSIAIKVTLQSNEKTLAENDISEISSKIIESVEKSTSGTVRS